MSLSSEKDVEGSAVQHVAAENKAQVPAEAAARTRLGTQFKILWKSKRTVLAGKPQ